MQQEPISKELCFLLAVPPIKSSSFHTLTAWAKCQLLLLSLPLLCSILYRIYILYSIYPQYSNDGFGFAWKDSQLPLSIHLISSKQLLTLLNATHFMNLCHSHSYLQWVQQSQEERLRWASSTWCQATRGQEVWDHNFPRQTDLTRELCPLETYNLSLSTHCTFSFPSDAWLSDI